MYETLVGLGERMKSHRTLSSRKRIAGLIVLAIFLTGLAHGLLHSASELHDTGHFAEAEECFLGAPLATAPSVAEIGVPDWLHGCASLHPAQTPRPSFSSHFPPARAPPLV